MDNLLVTTPDPPIVDVTAGLTNSALQLQFASRAGWLYTLERTDDFHSWSNVSSATPGVKGRLALSDTNALDAKAYYRVRAERP